MYIKVYIKIKISQQLLMYYDKKANINHGYYGF